MRSADQIALAIVIDPGYSQTVVGVRPSGAHLAGKLEFPGGMVEPEESPHACAEREALEETGLAVEVIDAWPPVLFSYPERSVELHPFVCIASPEEPLMTPWLWMPVSSLDPALFPQANQGMIARLKELAGIAVAR